MTSERRGRPLRVLLVGHSYISIEIAQKKARALAQLDNLEIEVVAPRRFFELGHWMDVEIPPKEWGYPFHALPIGLPSVRGQRHAFFYKRGLRRVIRDFRPDVIDLWEEPYSAATSQVVLARRLYAPNARLILSPSALVAKRHPFPFSLGERFVISRCDYVVGRTPDAVNVMRAKGYTGRSMVIGHGIDLDTLAPLDMAECRRQLDLPAGPLIVFLGRVVHDKGIDTIIEALTSIPAARLAIYGEGPEEGALRDLAATRGVGDRVIFGGPIAAEAVGQVLNAGDVVAMPSRIEPWGRVAVETLACETPIVVGGGFLPQLIGPHGWTVPPDDVPALAAALTEALGLPPEERARRVAAGAEYARQFSWEALASEWLQAYEESLRDA